MNGDIKGLWAHNKTGKLVLAIAVSSQTFKDGTTEEVVIFRDASYEDINVYHKEKSLFLGIFTKYIHEVRSKTS